MKKCPSCGEELPDDALFCRNCGTKMTDGAAETRENISVQAQNQTVHRSNGSIHPDHEGLGRTEDVHDGLYASRTERESGWTPSYDADRRSRPQRTGFRFEWIIVIVEIVAILCVFILIFRAISKDHIITDTDSWKTETADSESQNSTEMTNSTASSVESEGASGNAAAAAAPAPVENSADAVIPTAYVTDAEPEDLNNYQEAVVGSASASSELHQPGNKYNNAAIKAADNDQVTSWQEGSAGDGSGEWLSFNLSAKRDIQYIDCKLGNWRDDYYAKNNRPKTMTLNIGGQSYSLEFTDAQIDHYIVFSSPISATDASFVIDSVYTGANADCCVAEITFYSGS